MNRCTPHAPRGLRLASAVLLGLTAACHPMAHCPQPGAPTPGAADAHCTGSDGAARVTATRAEACAGVAPMSDGGLPDVETCPYGPTRYGTEADDDDCKYHVRWTHGDLCEGPGGVHVSLVVTKRTDGLPLTGAGTLAEIFTTGTSADPCALSSVHAGPNSGVELAEGPAGTYSGLLQFDRSGAWTVRFHFFGQCDDAAEASPHGHAAFHLTLP